MYLLSIIVVELIMFILNIINGGLFNFFRCFWCHLDFNFLNAILHRYKVQTDRQSLTHYKVWLKCNLRKLMGCVSPYDLHQSFSIYINNKESEREYWKFAFYILQMFLDPKLIYAFFCCCSSLSHWVTAYTSVYLSTENIKKSCH